MFRGVAQLVARGVWDAEVASSSLVAPTIQGGKNKENLFSLFDRRRMERFCDSKSLPLSYCDYLHGRFLFMFVLIELAERPKG